MPQDPNTVGMLGWQRAIYDLLMSNAYVGDDGRVYFRGPDGGVFALSEVVPVADPMTASGVALASAGYFRGIQVTACVGGPQTIVAYDNASAASGTVLATFTVPAGGLGGYLWDGNGATPGNGSGARVEVLNGVYLSISGGASRTILPMVEAA